MILVITEMTAVFISTWPESAVTTPESMPVRVETVCAPMPVRPATYVPNSVWSTMYSMHLTSAKCKKYRQ
jgi:hypothetical protein